MDMLLQPYYEKDTENGAITEEEAVWMIACLLFNDTHYAQIGGLSPAGDRETLEQDIFFDTGSHTPFLYSQQPGCQG